MDGFAHKPSRANPYPDLRVLPSCLSGGSGGFGLHGNPFAGRARDRAAIFARGVTSATPPPCVAHVQLTECPRKCQTSHFGECVSPVDPTNVKAARPSSSPRRSGSEDGRAALSGRQSSIHLDCERRGFAAFGFYLTGYRFRVFQIDIG